MLTKKVACPSCGVGLRIADTLPAGKKITCPKCSESFAVPAGNALPSAAKAAVTARPGQAVPAPSGEDDDREERPAARRSRKAPPPPEDDEDLDEEVEERPRPRRSRKKKKKAAANSALVWGLVLGVALLLVGGGVAAVLVFRSAKKADPVASTNPPPERPRGPGPGMGRPGGGPGAPGGPGPRAVARGPEARAPAPAAGGGSDQASAGRKVYDEHRCARCHTIGGAGGPPGGGKSRGPDLGSVGRDPSHTVEWLAEHVRNPQSHRPDSRMPAYDGKIQPQDLQSLAEYLASLK